MTALFESPAQSLGDHIDRLATIEATAETVRAWQPMLIPGLLQTYAYAVAAIQAHAPALPLETVAIRARRRGERLAGIAHPQLRDAEFIVDEAALRRPVAGRQALTDQLGHLLAVDALQPRVRLRILPSTTDVHPGLAGAFTLYRAEDRHAVFTETLTGSHIATRPEDVAAYASAWERLERLALSPAASRALIDSYRESR
ncbi:DUF5753 domain-containing protein [Streptomyces sp. NPDC052225]|uniref:DUF5753 domain-containing protein n=1 Tax=Streptomyces sp. NPDC052225 TaxID=3154949 RepID=UPI0034417F0A